MCILSEIYQRLDKDSKPKEYFYVTDLGVCPRKVIMNFGDYEKKPLTVGEKLMFFKADNDHKAMAQLLALSHNYAVVKEEFSINKGLPEMWHGRLDCLVFDSTDKSFYPVDWKGTRSLKYQAGLPKTAHVTQIQSYIMALRNMGWDISKGKIIYTDRTGSYEGLEFDIDYDELVINEVMKSMKGYEDYLLKQYKVKANKYKDFSIKSLKMVKLDNFINKNGDILIFMERDVSLLPEIMPREIKQIKTQKNKNITKPAQIEFYLVPNWQCQYCYYQGLSCKPNMSKNKIATIKDNILHIRKGYEKYKDDIYNIWQPDYKDIKASDFYNFVKGVSKK